jgi:hypothetical protein
MIKKIIRLAGLKPPAQHMKALRADGGVGFSRLPCTEAGIYPAESPSKAHPPTAIFLPFI